MTRKLNPRVLLGVAAALVLVPLSVSAVPTLISFSAGQPIKAADINSNFTTLRTAIQGLESGTRCKVHVESCNSTVCQFTCPTGYHVEAGGCDVAAGGAINENMPAGPMTFENGEHPVNFFTKWNCESITQNIQGIYAYCCQD